jgi:hypothetical protein
LKIGIGRKKNNGWKIKKRIKIKNDRGLKAIKRNRKRREKNLNEIRFEKKEGKNEKLKKWFSSWNDRNDPWIIKNGLGGKSALRLIIFSTIIINITAGNFIVKFIIKSNI